MERLHHYRKVIISVFFYGFVFALPWQTVYFLREVFIGGEKWHYGTIGLYISDLFLLGFVLSVGVFYCREFFSLRRYKKSHVFLVSVLFLAYLFLSSLWSYDPVKTLSFALLFAVSILFLYSARFVMHEGIIRLQTIFLVLVCSTLPHAFIGLWQFIFQTDFSSTLLGLSYHDSSLGGISVIETMGGERWLRGYGGFSHPNIFGGMMAFMALVSLYYYVGVVRFMQRAHMYTMHFLFVRLGLMFASFIFFAGLLVSFSRSGYLIFFTGLLVSVLLSAYRKEVWLYARQASRIVFGYFLIAIVFLVFYGELFVTRGASQARLEQLSLGERTSQVSESFTVIGEHLLFGVGAGAYSSAIAQMDKYSQPIWLYQNVHNVDLLLLSELGLVGSLLLAYLFYLFLKGVFKRYELQQSKDANSKVHVSLEKSLFYGFFLGGFLLIFISGLFDHWLWSSHFGILFCALWLYIISFSRFVSGR